MADLGFDWLNPPQLPPAALKPVGCDCTGGRQMHTAECALFKMPTAERLRAIDDVEGAVRAHTDMLNARLRAWEGSRG